MKKLQIAIQRCNVHVQTTTKKAQSMGQFNLTRCVMRIFNFSNSVFGYATSYHSFSTHNQRIPYPLSFLSFLFFPTTPPSIHRSIHTYSFSTHLLELLLRPQLVRMPALLLATYIHTNTYTSVATFSNFPHKRSQVRGYDARNKTRTVGSSGRETGVACLVR